MTVNTKISIIMGSKSDLNIMSQAASTLDELKILYELTIVSAHRTPQRMFDFAANAKSRGIEVIIAGAGGAAHLPGMVAALTPLPVIGVPIKSSNSLDGWDSILSILQMPGGVPVATVALNQAKNAALLAARILGLSQPGIQKTIEQNMESQRKKVESEIAEMDQKGYQAFLG